jgi:phage baseplate assembly protein W
MAGRITIKNKLFPNDLYKEASTLAVKLPMNNPKYRNKAGLFNMSYTTEEQVISNFINLLLTKDGERFMQPRFGVGLMYYIFEQNTQVISEVLRRKIEEQVEIWLPYVQLREVLINTPNNLIDDNTINIQIVFSVMKNGANRVITIFANEQQDVNLEVQ